MVPEVEVILGGYSYGSLIVKHLPSLSSILSQFQNTAQSLPGSSHSEIHIRAEKLALQRNTELEELRRQSIRRHAWQTLSMGGEETSPAQRRRSSEHHHGHRSLDVLRSLKHSHLHREKRHLETGEAREGDNVHGNTDTDPHVHPPSLGDMPVPEHAYLLVSPLLPPLSTLAAPALGYRFWNRSGSHNESFASKPTLAVFGDRDVFVSAKKTRAWAERLRSENSGGFVAAEVGGAGHFWLEPGVEGVLRDALKRWGREVWGGGLT